MVEKRMCFLPGPQRRCCGVMVAFIRLVNGVRRYERQD